MNKKNKYKNAEFRFLRPDLDLLNKLIFLLNEYIIKNLGTLAQGAETPQIHKKVFLIENIMQKIYAYAGMSMPKYTGSRWYDDCRILDYNLLQDMHASKQKIILFPFIERTSTNYIQDFSNLISALNTLIHHYESKSEKKAEAFGKKIQVLASSKLKKLLRDTLKQEIKDKISNGLQDFLPEAPPQKKPTTAASDLLPAEIWSQVFEHLDNVGALRKSCTFFNNVLKNDLWWKKHLAQHFPERSEYVKSIRALDPNETYESLYKFLYKMRHSQSQQAAISLAINFKKIPKQFRTSPVYLLNHCIPTNLALNKLIHNDEIDKALISEYHTILVISLDLSIEKLQDHRKRFQQANTNLFKEMLYAADLRQFITGVSISYTTKKMNSNPTTHVTFNGKEFVLKEVQLNQKQVNIKASNY